MSVFLLSIDTDNAHLQRVGRNTGIAALLRMAADQLDQGVEQALLHDPDGTVVGSYAYPEWAARP